MGQESSCLGLRERALVKDGPRPERHPYAQLEKSEFPTDKKKTFTVLVTGMGVSKTIHISFS